MSDWTVTSSFIIANCVGCNCIFRCKIVDQYTPLYYYVMQNEIAIASSQAFHVMYDSDLNVSEDSTIFCKKVSALR